MEWLFTLVMRWLFSFLDSIVIFLIEVLYGLLMDIADTNVLGDLVYQFLGRIYTFLGIFMLFKLTLTIINYIVNPDSLTDKGKGFGKLISNVVISLILLVVTPNLFSMAFQLQGDILQTNALYQIITGNKLTHGQSDKNNEIQAREIAFGVYSAFIYPKDTNQLDPANDKYAYTSDSGDERCKSDNPQCLVKTSTVTAEDSKGFRNEYWYLISTICGAVVCYMLLTFCLDTAVRAIKLNVLQIIAPIPILSMIDPKEGTKKLSSWAKECGKTYADLFIRLAGIFFSLSVIHAVLASDGSTMQLYSDPNQQQTGLFVRVFIIIGCLMFAKQLPQFIENTLGIKMSGGGFSLKKKLGSAPGLSRLGAGALGFAGGMAANALATKGNLRSMLAGGTSGLARGALSKEKNVFKAGGAGAKGAVDARKLRDERRLNDDVGIGSFAKRSWSKVESAAGIESGASRFDKMSSSLGAMTSVKAELDKYLEATNDTVKRNKAQYDAAIQKGDVAGAETWKKALDLSKNHAIATTSDDTVKVLMDKYNEKVREVNTIFAGAKDRNNNAIHFTEAKTYSDVKSGDGKAKGTDTALKNDGVTVNGKTWSQEHTGVKSNK